MSSTIPNASGIYRIVCTVNSRIYVGSTKNLRKRQSDHFNQLRSKTHGNQKLQRAFDKYGEQCFLFEIIELVLPPFLLEREQYWLELIKPWGNNGFNIARSAHSFYLDMTHSAETRAQMRASKLGKPSNHRGKKASLQTREQQRLAHLGKPAHNRGKKHSPETIAKMRNAQIGNTYSLGVKASAEARVKLSQAHMKTFIVTSPDGIEYSVHGLKQFCQDHNLDDSCLGQVAKGKRKQYKGWKAHYM
jgi:group I intron endonuclease